MFSCSKLKPLGGLLFQGGYCFHGGVIQARNPAFPNLAWQASHHAVCRNVYLWLSQRMQGKALTIFFGVPFGIGFEAFRLSFAEYRPIGDTSEHNLLITIIQHRWWCEGVDASRPFMDVILDWEKLIIHYEFQSRETVGDGTRCAVVSGFAPQMVNDMVASSPQETRHTYRLLRQAVQDFLLSSDPSSFVPGVQVTCASADIGAIGFDKQVCGICGKTCHHETKCWHRGGKGGKHGKNGCKPGNGKNNSACGRSLEDVKCFYCKKPGHLKTDCRKFQADKQAGNIAVVNSSVDDNGLWCMACTATSAGDQATLPQRTRFLLRDGGADEHCATRAFAPKIPLQPTSMELRDAHS